MNRTRKDLKPEDIVLICDDREQAPLDLLLTTEVGRLQTGDYSVKGLEHLVAVERKSLQDLVMCCGRERDRFDRCIERLRGYTLPMIVIEASESQVELKQYRGEIDPNSVLGSVHSWRARGINIDWAGDRQTAAIHISRTLYCFARERWRELQSFYKNLRIAGGQDGELQSGDDSRKPGGDPATKKDGERDAGDHTSRRYDREA